MSSNKTEKYYPYIIGLLALLIFLFKLGSRPLQLWDESRLAINAYEMVQSGNFWVTTYLFEPDLWNTKPPLLIWLMAGSIKLFGYSEFALRLPSAIAAIVLTFSIYWFCKKHLKNATVGFLSSLVLISSYGFTRDHVAFSADYDALLCLWLFLYSIQLFMYFKSGLLKHALLFGLFLFLAGMTKGIAGYMLLPPIVLFGFSKKEYIKRLFSDKLIVSTIFSFAAILGFYYLRDSISEGYIAAVFENELGGRFNETLEGHSHPFYFYLKHIAQQGFVPWLYILPFVLLLTFKSKNTGLKQFSAYSLLAMLVYLLIISIANTKLRWYDAPIYPFLTIPVGVGLYEFLHLRFSTKAVRISILSVVMVFSIGMVFGKNKFAKKYSPENRMDEERYAEFYQHLVDNGKDIGNDYQAVSTYYNGAKIYYNYIYDVNQVWISEIDTSKPVLTCHGWEIELIEKEGYAVKVIEDLNQRCFVCEVKKKKAD